jgi:hypothetical protein
MKLLTTALVLAISASTFASSLPSISSDCATKVRRVGYCLETESGVKVKVNATNSVYDPSSIFTSSTKSSVEVFLYAEIKDASEKFDGFEDSIEDGIQELVDLYTDHPKWPNYSDKSGKNVMKFHHSFDLPEVSYADAIDGIALPHFANYTVFDTPLGDEKTTEVAYNFYIQPWSGADISLKFETIFNKFTGIPGYGTLKAPVGLKYKTGTLHVAYDEDEDTLKLYSITHVIPSVNLILSLAEAHVAKGIEAIFVGMLSEYIKK